MKHSIIALALFGFCSSLQSQNKDYELIVDAKNPKSEVQPTMYGLFFEDINFAADGGLYAELIKNRSFEFPQTLMGWKTFGKIETRTDNAPFERNPHYVRLTYSGHKEKHTGLENEGFRGIGLQKDNLYRFSVWARNVENTPQKIRIEFIDATNSIIAKQSISIDSQQWKKYQIELKSPKEEAHAFVRIYLASQGPVDLDHISLFPKETWKNRENGLRKDLSQALADLSPGVFRFPGGCIVEGTQLDDRYDWKKTIGAVENRPLNQNRWHYTFTDRFYPDYFQSYGLGFFEFFQLSEDIGASPLPVLNCGLSCQFQNTEESHHAPLDGLDPYIQDALDLIEFANGDINSKWGKIRSDMGHPKPFNMKFLGVGNEQWGPEYVQRLEVFTKAIKARYPNIKIIGSSGPSPDGQRFDYLWPEMKRLKVDLVDEHYYKSPEWFLQNANRYDNYDRKGPKVFAGEYASHPKNRKNNFEAALTEAAFMTGLERNADVVHMATYAPLFAHVDAWQWKPDLIWFDNLNSVRTPDFYTQQLYAQNKGTHTLSISLDHKNISGQDGLYASAVVDKNKKEIIIKVVNAAATPKNISLRIDGVKSLQQRALITSLHANADDENTLENPIAVIPKDATISFKDNKLQTFITAQTFSMYKISY